MTSDPKPVPAHPLRQKRYRGAVANTNRLRNPERGDVVTLAFPERGMWIYDGTRWRRMKTPSSPNAETAAQEAVRRLRGPLLSLNKFHGKGHSMSTLDAIPDLEPGDYATGPGNSTWVYDGIGWRRLKKKKTKGAGGLDLG